MLKLGDFPFCQWGAALENVYVLETPHGFLLFPGPHMFDP
jgi:hypothetical protein